MFSTVMDLKEMEMLGLTPQQSCWPTDRPVSYSAGLYDLQYRLYIGQAY
jgi:hypothetical protein